MALPSIPAWSVTFKRLAGMVVALSALAWGSAYAGRTPGQHTTNQVVLSRLPDPARDWHDPRVMILCYHDVPTRVFQDVNGVDLFSLVRELEFMRDYGCHFVSVKDIIAAHQGKKKLPDKAVLLTFDDSYVSFYRNVFPLLKIYHYPCMLAVISGWIDHPPQDAEIKDYRFMTWPELKEVVDSGLVELASHSENMHRAFLCNPQGNTAHALVTRIYDPQNQTYETEKALRQRVFDDLRSSYRTIAEKTGHPPVALVWPYGRYNELTLEEAFRAGFQITFSLDDGVADARDIRVMPRYMLQGNPPIDQFARKFKVNFVEPLDRQRMVQADLDLIYDPDPKVQEKNLDAFIERIYHLKPSALLLQAFCDIPGDGNIRSVYFPNRVLPMKADLFNRVCRAVNIRGIPVFAWMPMLCIQLPDAKPNERLRVREFKDGRIRDTSAWYRNRLSPFAPETVQLLGMLYADLAANALIDGVIFQDDGYLNDFEDFSPAGKQAYLQITHGKLIPFAQLTPARKQQWTTRKTDQLIALTDHLKKQVLYYRPAIPFARTIYASVVTDPKSEEWFAQNYAKCLKNYDYTVIMSYPRMDKIARPEAWFQQLVGRAKQYPDGIAKTVFKVQTYDWARKEWIPADVVNLWLRTLAAAGAWNLAYYPDDYTVDQPQLRVIRMMMSFRDFPLPEKK